MKSLDAQFIKTAAGALLGVSLIMLADKLLGRFEWNYAGDFTFWQGGLEWPATINIFLQEVWFAECLFLVILPLWLWVKAQRLKSESYPSVRPWAIIAAALVVMFGWQLSGTYQEQHLKGASEISYALHRGPEFFVPVYSPDIDTLLFSVFPYFLINELSLLVLIGLILSGDRYYKRHPRN